MVLANSLGLTNMKEAQFDEVKKRYPDEFQGIKWSDVVGNSEVSIKATAYNLTILRDDAASQAIGKVRRRQPLNQFLASGYNAGGTTGRSLQVATGGNPFLSNEVDYGQRAMQSYQLADKILCGSGAYKCTTS